MIPTRIDIYIWRRVGDADCRQFGEGKVGEWGARGSDTLGTRWPPLSSGKET